MGIIWNCALYHHFIELVLFRDIYENIVCYPLKSSKCVITESFNCKKHDQYFFGQITLYNLYFISFFEQIAQISICQKIFSLPFKSHPFENISTNVIKTPTNRTFTNQLLESKPIRRVIILYTLHGPHDTSVRSYHVLFVNGSKDRCDTCRIKVEKVFLMFLLSNIIMFSCTVNMTS